MNAGARHGTALALAAAGIALALTCLPGVHWHDTGEFPAVTWWWSLSHPPGHAVHAVVARLPQLLPVGDLGFRANASSALLLAVAIAFFERLLAGLAPKTPPLARIAAACSPAFWPAIWLQGARAEVYACQLALLGATALCAQNVAKTRDARPFLAAGLLSGLSGACHSLLGLAFLPLVGAVALRARLPLRAWVSATLAGGVGLAAALYLPLRAHAGLDVGWGNPNDAARVLDTLLARDWQRNLVSAGSTGLDLGQNFADISGALLEQVGLPGALLLGLASLAALPGALRRSVWPVLGVAAVLVPVLATRFFYPYDGTNPDLGGYFAPAAAALLAFGAFALDGAGRHAPWILAFAPYLALGPDPGHRMGSRTAERAIRQALVEVPPGGVLLASDYTTWFQAAWMRVVTEERPDATVLFRGRLAAPWVAERARRVRAFGALGPDAERLDGFPEAFAAPDVRLEGGVHMDQLGPVARSLRPTGLLARLDAGPPSAEGVRAAWTGISSGPLDDDARYTTAFRHALAAENLLAVDDPATVAPIARWHLRAAVALLEGPPDPYLDELWARWARRAPPSPSDAPQGL